MAVDQHKNFAYSLVATAPSPATSGTSLIVTAGQGALFPTPPFNATVWITGANPLTTNAEIVRVTGISTDTLTIIRAQEGSAARTVVVGDQIAATVTKKTLNDVETKDVLQVYNTLGGAILAETMGMDVLKITASNVLANQVIRFIPVYLPQAATITGVKWWQVIQGNFTANNYNGVGLYSYSGGTLTLVASSTDDANIWKATANTWSSKAFASTYAAAAGLYYVACLYCTSSAVAAPSIGCGTALVNNAITAVDFTNSSKIIALLAAQTALPTPTQLMSGLNGVSAVNFYAAIY